MHHFHHGLQPIAHGCIPLYHRDSDTKEKRNLKRNDAKVPKRIEDGKRTQWYGKNWAEDPKVSRAGRSGP